MTWVGARLGRVITATLRYKIRLERIARKVYLWNEWKQMEEKMNEDDREEWIASGVGDEDGWKKPR